MGLQGRPRSRRDPRPARHHAPYPRRRPHPPHRPLRRPRYAPDRRSRQRRPRTALLNLSKVSSMRFFSVLLVLAALAATAPDLAAGPNATTRMIQATFKLVNP